MKRAGRSILAIVAGANVAIMLISAVEAFSSLVYPPPPVLDPNAQEAMRQHIAQLPIGAFLLVLVGWAVGSAAGGWVAARLAGRAPLVHGVIIGLFFAMAASLTMLMIPHPLWMWVGGIVLPVACCYLGARLVRGSPRRPAMVSA
jgi:hypothetical protein